VCLFDFFVILLTWPFIVLYDLGNCAKIVYHLLRNVQSVLSAFVNILSLIIHALEFQVTFRLGNAILTPHYICLSRDNWDIPRTDSKNLPQLALLQAYTQRPRENPS
jgi:hypothetical protein